MTAASFNPQKGIDVIAFFMHLFNILKAMTHTPSSRYQSVYVAYLKTGSSGLIPD